MNPVSEFKDLENLIKNEKSVAKKQELTLKQIEILKNVQKEFLIKAEQSGYSLESYNVLAIMQDQFKAMKTLAKQVNLPTTEYDNELNNISIKMFGDIDRFK